MKILRLWHHVNDDHRVIADARLYDGSPGLDDHKTARASSIQDGPAGTYALSPYRKPAWRCHAGYCDQGCSVRARAYAECGGGVEAVKGECRRQVV